MKSWKNTSLLSLSPSAMCVLLSGCLFGENKTYFSYNTANDGSVGDDPTVSDDPHLTTGTDTTTGTSTNTGTNTGTSTSTGTNTDTSTGTGTDTNTLVTALSTELFPAATSEIKKIDFLFVVDNSGSMADNQQKLANGFEAFANTFYRRADLDICTTIITSDRYLGRTGSNGYQRVRTLPCTKPADWSAMTNAQQTNYIDQLIAEFKTKINVGTNGSGTELVGKSLVTFLHDQNSWSSNMDTTTRTTFFRTDAVANISLVTDENNWFYSGPNHSEASNDLPAIQNAVVHNSPTGAVDARKGIKNYMDDFFTIAQPTHGLSYSVSSFLETTKPANTLPGLAMNLTDLSAMVGRESAKTDIGGTAASYANLYNSIGDSIVLRASAFNVVHDIYEPLFPSLTDLRVTIVRADSSRVDLTLGSHYTVLMPNGVVLDQATSNTTSTGDHIEVHYRYDTAH
jgi:hypothetical protein